MIQYIDKSDLIKEIKRRIKEIDEIGTYLSPKGVLTNLLCHLDTLKIKEVDLRKKVGEYIDNNFTSVEEPESLTTVMQMDDMVKFAEYFFKLGLKKE